MNFIELDEEFNCSLSFYVEEFIMLESRTREETPRLKLSSIMWQKGNLMETSSLHILLWS